MKNTTKLIATVITVTAVVASPAAAYTSSSASEGKPCARTCGIQTNHNEIQVAS